MSAPMPSLRVDRDPFADDVLERLAKANQEYQRAHGHYIVPLAERLLAARRDLDDEKAMSRQVVETLRGLQANWRDVIEEQIEGEPLLENILYWAIDDLGGYVA